MKVIICFGAVRVVVPCGDGDLPVGELADRAAHRYLKTLDKSGLTVKISSLKTLESDAILDPGDKLGDVVEDKEQLVATFTITSDSLYNQRNGDGMSGSSGGTPSPELNPSSRGLENKPPYHRDDFNSSSETYITNHDINSKGHKLTVRRGSDELFNTNIKLSSGAAPIISHQKTPSVPIQVTRTNTPKDSTSNRPKSSAFSHNYFYQSLKGPTRTPSHSVDSNNLQSVNGFGRKPNQLSDLEALKQNNVSRTSKEIISRQIEHPQNGTTTRRISNIKTPKLDSRSLNNNRSTDHANHVSNNNNIKGIYNGQQNNVTSSNQNFPSFLPSTVKLNRPKNDFSTLEPSFREVHRDGGGNFREGNNRRMFQNSTSDSILQPYHQTISPDVTKGKVDEFRPSGDKMVSTKDMIGCSSFNVVLNNEDRFYINLVKGSKGLGFSVTTQDNKTSERDSLIYVKKILPSGSAIEDGRLQPGDCILEVNGVAMKGKPQDEVVSFLRKIPAGGCAEMLVTRKSQKSYFPKNLNLQTSQENKHDTIIGRNQVDRSQAEISSQFELQKRLDDKQDSESLMSFDDGSSRKLKFTREGLGRQSMSEKRKGHLDPRITETFNKIKTYRTETKGGFVLQRADSAESLVSFHSNSGLKTSSSCDEILRSFRPRGINNSFRAAIDKCLDESETSDKNSVEFKRAALESGGTSFKDKNKNSSFRGISSILKFGKSKR